MDIFYSLGQFKVQTRNEISLSFDQNDIIIIIYFKIKTIRLFNLNIFVIVFLKDLIKREREE